LGVYAIALLAAITWGLYSNWSRKWAGGANDSGAVPVFLICTGVSLGVVRLFVYEVTTFSASTVLELAYMVIFPTMLAYIFWDAAMRKGRMITIVALSYFIPLFSTLISALRLGVHLRPEIWLAAGMIIIGAYFSRAAIVE
jgi:drug/metabolite transporter (DMT)-like permease